MGNNKIIGAKIKNIRESKQLSIEEVAERSGLGIEQIERIEGNLDFPSLAYLSEAELQSIINKQNEYGLKDISIHVSQLTNDRLTEKELVDYIIQYKNDDDLQQIDNDKKKESPHKNK